MWRTQGECQAGPRIGPGVARRHWATVPGAVSLQRPCPSGKGSPSPLQQSDSRQQARPDWGRGTVGTRAAPAGGEGRLRPEESHRWPHTVGPDGHAGLERPFQQGLSSRDQGDSPFPSCSSETHLDTKLVSHSPAELEGFRGGEEWMSQARRWAAAVSRSRPPRSPTVTFTFRAAGQPSGGHWWGPGRGAARLPRGICVFPKLQCWAHPQRE